MKNRPLHIARQILALASLLVAATGSGCSLANRVKAITPSGQAPPKRTVVLCLFDISGSTGSPTIRAKYFAQFNTLARKNPEGTAYLVALISNNSWSTPGRSLRMTMPKARDFNSQEDYKIKLTEDTARLVGYTQKMIFLSTSKERTDLMGALVTAEKLLKGSEYGAFEDKRIVIFSDMVEQTAEHDFTSVSLLAPANVPNVINTLKETGRIPNLKGVSMWAVGAGDTADGGLPPKVIYQTQNFWLTFFQEAGANTDATRYGSELFNYPEWKD